MIRAEAGSLSGRGLTVGRPEDKANGLKSRGLSEEAARTLLAHGFANEVLAGIPVEPIRTWLDSVLTARLRGGRVAEEETS